MTPRKCLIAAALLAALCFADHASGLDWSDGDGGQVRWAWSCDWNGNDVGNQQSRGEDCGGLCLRNPRCTHFTWTDYLGGTCWMKGNVQVSEGNAVGKNSDQAVCGFRKSSSSGGGGGGGAGNVKGTRWADTSDNGGCQMPNSVGYSVQEAVALGQEGALGGLKWRNGLCGQVLNVDCGKGNLQAVVASTCNLGSGTCGVDMIGKTWTRATGLRDGGETQCQVSLASTNPMSDGGPICFHRPYSELNNAYFQSLGVFNTGGRIPRAASLAGVSGQFQSGSSYLDFYGGNGRFVGGAPVRFEFEDGSSAEFRFSDCRDPQGVKIFQ